LPFFDFQQLAMQMRALAQDESMVARFPR
jgi:hypothetical protein